jgi:hypothetical protein
LNAVNAATSTVTEATKRPKARQQAAASPEGRDVPCIAETMKENILSQNQLQTNG